MADFNKVMLMGRLTRDPEMRYTPSGMAVAKVGLAVGRRYFNKNTQQTVEESTFIDCEAWGKQAETINQYMRKGRPLFIEGRLKFDTWESKEGQKRSKLSVVIENFQFVDSGGGGGNGGGNGGGDSGGQQRNYQNQGGQQGGQQDQDQGGGGAGRGAAAPQVQAGKVSDGGGSGGGGSGGGGQRTGGNQGGENYDFEDIPF